MSIVEICAKANILDLPDHIQSGKVYKLYSYTAIPCSEQKGSVGFRLDRKVLFYKKSNIFDLGMIFTSNPEEVEIPESAFGDKFYLLQEL